MSYETYLMLKTTAVMFFVVVFVVGIFILLLLALGRKDKMKP